MSCAIKFIKFILFTLNFLFLIIGLALLIAGAWAILNVSSFLQAIAFAFDGESTGGQLHKNSQLIQLVGYTCVSLGLFIFLVAFFGCCGVITDSYCLLITYSVIVSLLFLMKIICILVFLLLGEKITPLVTTRVMESFSQNYRGALGFQVKDGVNAYSQIMDAFMLRFSCCAINGPSDFEDSNASKLWHTEGRVYVDESNVKRTGDEVGLPVACCQFTNKGFATNATFTQLHEYLKSADCPLVPIKSYNSLGCLEKVTKTFRNYTVVFVVVPVILAIIEVVGVILASALAHEMNQEGDQLYY